MTKHHVTSGVASQRPGYDEPAVPHLQRSAQDMTKQPFTSGVASQCPGYDVPAVHWHRSAQEDEPAVLLRLRRNAAVPQPMVWWPKLGQLATDCKDSTVGALT